MWLPGWDMDTFRLWVGLSSSLLSLFVSLITFAVAALIFLVRRWPRLRNYAVTSPIRRAATMHPARSDALVDSITRFLCERAVVLGGGPSVETREERLLPDLLRHLQKSRSPDGAHWTEVAEVALRLARDATRPANRSFIWDHLVADESERVQELLKSLGDALTPFAELQPVDRVAAGYFDTSDSFAAFVTAYSGNTVLADAAASRSRCADSVMLWHSSRFLAPAGDNKSFDDVHATDAGEHACGFTPSPGDYDGHVVSTRGACLATLERRDGLVFVLETEESCYGASEGGLQSTRFVKGAGRACKNLTSQLDQPDAAVAPFAVNAASKGVRLKSLSATPHRVLNLTGQLAVVTSDRHLLLARRSGNVEHSKNLYSASAGGIISPLEDIDEHGLPDLLQSTLRETREEIGLDPIRQVCKPVAVYQMNVARSDRDDAGQLVTAVLYFTYSKHTHEYLESTRRIASDQARGAYETQAFEAVPIDDLDQVADWLNTTGNQCDGHAIMAVLYSCLVVHSRRSVIEELSRHVRLPRWYLEPQATDGEAGFLLARNPWHTSEGLQLPKDMPAEWRTAWDRVT